MAWAILSDSLDAFALLEAHQEGLEFGCPGIRIHRRGRQKVCQRAEVVWVTGIPPVNGESDVPDRHAVDPHRRQPLGHHGNALDRSARRSHSSLRAVGDALCGGELLRDLDVEAWLQL